MRKILLRLILISGFIVLFSSAFSQTTSDSSLQNATLQNCVQYAIKHYPLIRQALLDEQITEHEIKSKLADWFPQISLAANYQNYFQLPSAYFSGNVVKSGIYNNSTVSVSGTQNIFNRDALLASKSAGDVRKQIRQLTESDKIDLAVNVSKAFYDVLLTQKQIDLLDEDIVRLERSFKDSYNQYLDGIVDKTDYKRATISLNNSKAQKKIYSESVKANLANLKLQMGYPSGNDLELKYDSAEMEKEVLIDTNQTVNYDSRIEYRLLITQKRLQQANLQYNKWSFLPAINAFGSYNPSFFSSQFSSLYSQSFPYSFAGLQLSFPIFQGGKRLANIKVAELQVTRVDWDIVSIKNSISAQYVQALASYKGYLNDYFSLKENVELAKDVYSTLELQYRAGVKTYLDVITAETDLRSAQSNYTNALYQVLSSKLDVQKALGTVQY
ncbi:MAG TPA: TolC family protein [Puia sp.]|jgi:outer membrane protein|nr:TolC family protein [Puia sp.]